MLELTGISAAPGIAIGPAYLYLQDQLVVPRYSIGLAEIDSEITRFRTSAARAAQELEAIRERTAAEVNADQLQILDSHVLMIRDNEFLKSVETQLKVGKQNVEWILYQSVQDLLEKLGTTSDVALRERSGDLQDVMRRILNHLMQRERRSLSDLAEEVIVVGHDIPPSEAIAMNKRMVRGIAMDAGGRTSHTAIVARAFEIPSVLGLSTVTVSVRNGDIVIVDGGHGKIIVDPDQETLDRYEDESKAWQRHEVKLMGLHDLPAETRDGKLISLKANIEVPDEVDAAIAHGADGVGLYRSEFLFMRPGHLPSEEEQHRAYRGVLEALPNKPVTIRTVDVGGDKIVPELQESIERNPILGWRAIRFCLSNPEIFRTQLRALLRSSVHGKLEIMFPMISGLEELVAAINVLNEVKDDLKKEGVTLSDDLPVGIMIEVPSAAITADILARKSDFFSIGTNDLIQYTIAVDRGNEKIAYLYEPFHPGVLRMLRLIIDTAHAVGMPVAMCGEMAGDPLATMILLGLGLDEFSMSAGSIPEVKQIIRSTSIREAEEVVGAAMEMRTFAEIDRYLRRLLEDRFELGST